MTFVSLGTRCSTSEVASLFVDIRLRLLEKAAEIRDRGQIVRAQQLVDVANQFKKWIEASEERGALQRPRLRRHPPARRPDDD